MFAKTLRKLSPLFAATLALALTAIGRGADTNTPPDLLAHTIQGKDAAAAWSELEQSSYSPPTPASWETNAPSDAEKQKFFLPYVSAAADKAKDFYSKFPKDTNAGKARLLEFRLIVLSIRMGATNQDARLSAAEKSVLGEPSIGGEDRAAVLFVAAQNSQPDQARIMLQEITNTAPEGEIKEASADLLKKMENLGKHLDIQFTSVDGRPVDLAALKGKVVLVDFWATWCPPCRAEVPNVVKSYEQFHDKGFEVIGISLDKEKDQLTGFTKDNKMAWPQFFDGQYWNNKYAVQFGIHSIPTMWLVDKKGALRNIDAAENLAENVQRLLAE